MLELGGASPGHLGQPAGSVVKPGENLVPFPPGVGAQLLELAGRVLAGPRGLGACGVGACLGGGCALVSLRGLRERLVPGVIGGADAGPGLGPRLLDRAVPVFLGDGDARLGLLADPLELGGVPGGGLGQAVVSFTRPGLRYFCELPGGLRLGARCLGCLIGGKSCLLLCG